MPSDVTELSASVEEALREVSRIKTIVTEAVEDGVKSALKTVKQGRDAAQDMIGDAKQTVRKRPFQSMGVVFAAGVLAGALLGWLASRD